MKYNNNFPEFEQVIEEIKLVYLHDNRPWIIGYSGGKDSTLLVSLVIEAINKIPKDKRTKDIFVVSSDTGVENPIVARHMHYSSNKINEFSQKHNYNIKAEIIYPEITKSFWTLVIGLGYPTPEAPGFRWCTDRLKINPMN
ncbi:MAG TPA: DNA phosphorothioation system sulfurtransferase DndC, partial [Gallicola sp.]|nr:DNA phosphorothioation system sulfurtransferase DndC [Gallicola sp.]